jgi:hypothetical protein
MTSARARDAGYRFPSEIIAPPFWKIVLGDVASVGRAKERIEQGAHQAGTARDLEMPEGEPDAIRICAAMS